MELISLVRVDLEKLKSKHILAGYCATCITVMELYAISRGIDGALLAVVVAFVAGLGGYYGSKKRLEP